MASKNPTSTQPISKNPTSTQPIGPITGAGTPQHFTNPNDLADFHDFLKLFPIHMLRAHLCDIFWKNQTIGQSDIFRQLLAKRNHNIDPAGIEAPNPVVEPAIMPAVPAPAAVSIQELYPDYSPPPEDWNGSEATTDNLGEGK